MPPTSSNRITPLATHRQCVQAARDEGRVLWATHLHATAAPLEAPLTLPPRLAVVMGSERLPPKV